MLNNIKNINNNSIIKDLDTIINDNNIANKIINIKNIYDKINAKE